MPRKHRKNVGLIGLGIIGTRAAAGLRAAGFRVYVWNRSVKPAPNFLPNPEEVAQICDVIQLFVADAKALMDVLQAIKEYITPEHLIICSATIGPEATLEASKFVQQLGARFLDAPFTGSKLAAERRQLVYYVGGDEATYLRAKPVLEATSKAIIRVGGIGDAAIIKVVTNMIAAVSIEVLAEALAIVKKAGLPPDTLAAALEHNAARSGTMDLKLPKMMSGDYEPHFSLKHMFKDLQLGIQMAAALNVEVPSSAVTAGVMYEGIERGWGDDDFASIFRNYSEESGGQMALPESGEGETPTGENALGVAGEPPSQAGASEEPAAVEGGQTAEKPKAPSEQPSHIFAAIFDEEKSAEKEDEANAADKPEETTGSSEEKPAEKPEENPSEPEKL